MAAAEDIGAGRPPPTARSVLVTGAAGRIGRAFAASARSRYRLTLLDRPGPALDALEELGTPVGCDITDLEGVAAACQGIDTVVHLAAEPDPDAAWGDLLGPNIVGTYNVFSAAAAAGCRRVVFASSIHAVMGYAPERRVRPADPVNPPDLYGVTKCFGEAMGRYVAGQRGVSVVVLRIGAFQAPEAAAADDGAWMFGMYLAPDDLCDLLARAIDVEGLGFGIFHALSDDPLGRLDVTDTTEVLGYRPQHDLAELAPALSPLREALARRAADPRSGLGRGATPP